MHEETRNIGLWEKGEGEVGKDLGKGEVQALQRTKQTCLSLPCSVVSTSQWRTGGKSLHWHRWVPDWNRVDIWRTRVWIAWSTYTWIFSHKYVPQYGQFSGCLKPLMQTGDMEEASVEMTVSSDFWLCEGAAHQLLHCLRVNCIRQFLKSQEKPADWELMRRECLLFNTWAKEKNTLSSSGYLLS